MGRGLYKSKLFAFILLGTILAGSSITASARRQLLGQLVVEGSGKFVAMNGESVTNEMTISSATEIATASNSSARISIGGIGRIGLAPDSKLSLDFSESKINGVLTSGQVTMAVAPNTEIYIQTADGIITNPDRSKNSVIIIDFVNGRTRVKTELGAAALNGVVLSEGQISSVGMPIAAKRAENADIISGVLSSLAKAIQVEELLGIETQKATLGTKISDNDFGTPVTTFNP